ncbi:M56 family metallopeptidase [Pseudoalteromonas pernae]|uniref:M56 family metallopeptidase n=1 Tax=Pseudoalteromonas pernae TaxID=3118054 RepID=UPI00324274C2
MFAWIISQQVLICAVLLALILVERYALKPLSARFIYCLWLLVPAALVAQSLELSQPITSPVAVSKYLVTPLQHASSALTMSWEVVYWLVVSILLAGVSYQHLLFQRHIDAKLTSPSLTTADKAVPVYASRHINSPMLVGFIRPRIVLPHNLVEQSTADALAMMIEHEYVHLKRHDNIINALALIAVTLMWFNPLAWFGYLSLRRAQELSCDEQVLANKSARQRLLYGKSMVECASRSQLHSLAYSYYGDKNMMLQRLYNMQSANKGHIIAKMLSILLAVSSLTLIATVQAGDGHKAKKESQSGVAPIVRIEPKYPIEAAKQGISGSVVLRFQIANDGSVTDIAVVQSTPEAVFDKVAIEALKKWKYKPIANPEQEQLVQLDFKLNEEVKLPELTERINVTSH